MKPGGDLLVQREIAEGAALDSVDIAYGEIYFHLAGEGGAVGESRVVDRHSCCAVLRYVAEYFVRPGIDCECVAFGFTDGFEGVAFDSELVGAGEVPQGGGGGLGFYNSLHILFNLPLLGRREGFAVAGNHLAVSLALEQDHVKGFAAFAALNALAVGVEAPILLHFLIDVAGTHFLLALFSTGDQIEDFEGGQDQQRHG